MIKWIIQISLRFNSVNLLNLNIGVNEFSHFHIFWVYNFKTSSFQIFKERNFKIFCSIQYWLALSTWSWYIWMMKLVISLSYSYVIIRNLWKSCHDWSLLTIVTNPSFDICRQRHLLQLSSTFDSHHQHLTFVINVWQTSSIQTQHIESHSSIFLQWQCIS